MLIFNDGPPRAGKSYDSMLRHVLPALKAGRAVYARVDGLDEPEQRANIAAYLGMLPGRLDELLHHVSGDDVVRTFQCYRDGDKYLIPEHLKNALVIIDEVHEFYPSSMKPLERAQEQFFARHGQFGMDIIAASQAFDRLHNEIRVRVERKVLFRKLSHFAALEKIGIGGKGRYSMRFSVSDGNGKFKVIGSETHKYDPAIFPLYRSYQPGVTNVETYDAGKKEAGGAGLKFYLPLAIVCALVGIWFVVRIFDPDSSPMLVDGQVDQGEPIPGYAVPAATAQAAPALPVVVKSEPKHSPGVAYVLALAKEHRPRAAGKYLGVDGTRKGIIEFRSRQSHAAERLTVEQMESLGFTVEDHPYGYALVAEGETIIATAWPLDEWGTVSARAQSRVRGSGAGPRDRAGTSAAPDAEPVPVATALTSGAVIRSEQVHQYGDLAPVVESG